MKRTDEWAAQIEFARAMIAEAKKRARECSKGPAFNGAVIDAPDWILLGFMATALEAMIDSAAAMKFAEADVAEAERLLLATVAPEHDASWDGESDSAWNHGARIADEARLYLVRRGLVPPLPEPAGK